MALNLRVASLAAVVTSEFCIGTTYFTTPCMLTGPDYNAVSM
jgi:hypothetical protein